MNLELWFAGTIMGCIPWAFFFKKTKYKVGAIIVQLIGLVFLIIVLIQKQPNAEYNQIETLNKERADYYRGLLVRCGNAIGERAFIAEDGTKSEDVLCAKIPEIIETDYVNGGAA